MYKSILVLFLCTFINAPTSFGQDVDSASLTLSPAQMLGFREQAIKSIDDLESYIQVISDKQSNMDKRNTAVDLALDLFQSDTVTVETSTLKSPITHIHLITWYLNKLKLLPYVSVKIKWYKIYLGSSFSLGPDGNFYGSATFLQRFEGTSNNEMGNYKDITKRNIQIILKKVDAHKGDDKIDKYILKLGDIRVEETTNG